MPAVEPIKDEKHIKLLKKVLADNPRNLGLFVTGINTAFRASDLVRLTLGHFRGKSVGDEFTVIEKKTKKLRRVTINQSVHDVVRPLLRMYSDRPDDWLIFQSRKGDNDPLTPQYLHSLVNGWCKTINLPGNYGSHTLRKTWGYTQRVKYGVPIEVLMDAFNHSSQRVTMRYICLQPEEIKSAYLNCL